MFVLADSDCETSGEVTQTEKKVRQYCETCQIPFAILKKRKIENYIPDSILQQGMKDKKDVYATYLQLKQEQKDYYNLKKGFKVDRQTRAVTINKAQIALFSDQSPEAINSLKGGFGSNISNLFKDQRASFTKENIREICPQDPEEIEHILIEIERLI